MKTLLSFIKKPFKYFVIVAQIVATIEELSKVIAAIDSDPAIRELWNSLKTELSVALPIQTVRMHIEHIFALVRQLKS